VLDPWTSLAALSLHLAAAPEPPGPVGDPGPHTDCPADMRLVEGVHYENMGHVCDDTRREGKFDHCYAYRPGLTILEGPAKPLRVCVDQHEAPNRFGHNPMVLQSFEGAQKWCAKLGRRVCSEAEWELACEGPDHRPFAYGWRVDVKLCNSAKPWKPVKFEAFGRTMEEARTESNRLWQGSPSGRYKSCVSPFGIVDMMGNVEEWVASRPERKFPGVLMGGFWAKPWTGCRGTNDAHEPTFAFYETGFRCCKDPSPSSGRAPAAPDEPAGD
jgi:formylglycine-generating enzyme